MSEYGPGLPRLTAEMKTLLVTVSLAVAGISSAHAQVFRPSVGNGAVVGAVAGGLIGGHNGDRWAEGAIIGGVAGALIGAAIAPQQPVYHSAPPVVYQTPANYGQQVYAPSGTTVVQNAPVVYEQAPAQVVQSAPQVVYVESAPRVVYVPAPAPRVVYAPQPVVTFGFGYNSGPRYYGGYSGHSGHSRGHSSQGNRHGGHR